ncbi:hypothetical protein [Fulvivirga lutimaris]|uniref:hypothetical protein n=1 Tax=Fulvivirga lutimaris TaxID=1819566 RepID=UPI0012BCA5E3|nr:hypothetical protein [Fulvivirga lutimaris]
MNNISKNSVELSVQGLQISSATSYTTIVSLDRKKEELTAEEGKVAINVAGKSILTMLI